VTVPGGPLALSRWIDTGVVLSTAASDAPPPGTLRRNSKSEHTTAGNDGRSPSAGNIATRCDKWELASSNDLKDPEEGPRELSSRKVKSRIEAATSIRGVYFHNGIISRPPSPSPYHAQYRRRQ
jgi:hypothetical protein